MHFAYPPRKSSHPPPYAIKPPRVPLRRRRKVQVLAVLAFLILLLVFLLSRISRSPTEHVPFGTPEVVIVTTIENDRGDNFNDMVKENRRYYGALHGYATFFPNATDYDLGDKSPPRSWAKIPALRHALTLYPHSTYLFYLSSNSLIMNPSLTLSAHILSPSRLESIMQTGVPVVPPDSVIKTFSHLQGDKIDLVVTQDGEGLSQGAFILRRGDWATFFLDTWFDPLYRSYNFQKAEGHAMEHIVQWHGTILAKLALVPQRIMNSYTTGRDEGKYKDGDFIAHFAGCERDKKRNCEEEMTPLYREWQKAWHDR